MWHTFAEWCGVVALLLATFHFLFPDIGNDMGHSILNWWAGLSRQKREKRIQELQATLARIEALPVLSEFEDIVIRSLASLHGFFS
jgi:hypothetical protein